MKKINLKNFAFLILITAAISACGTLVDVSQQTANHIARPAFMVERQIDAGAFNFAAWERMHQRNAPATIYIEGQGLQETVDIIPEEKELEVAKADNNPDIDLLWPTPLNPVALHLASRDQSKNLGYIARPCQFIKFPDEKGCAAEFWNQDRFAPSVIAAYEAALDDIAARYDITSFNLVGYDGGANIAAVLAARRSDVLTLRTVAGNLNPKFSAANAGYGPLSPDAVLAVDYGSTLAKVPQHHFIGAADGVLPPGVYHSYRQAVGLSDCIHYSLIQDADHTEGWVQKWPDLLSLTPQCAKVDYDLPTLPPAGPFPNEDLYKGPRFSK